MQVTRVVEHIEEYHLSFTDEYGSGYGFDCTKDGQIIDDRRAELDLGRVPWSSLTYAISDYCAGEYTMHIYDQSRDLKHYEGTCLCGEDLVAYGGYDEFACEKCEREYNIFGQLLRADWRNNRSNWDSDVDDMTGYEEAYAGDE